MIVWKCERGDWWKRAARGRQESVSTLARPARRHVFPGGLTHCCALPDRNATFRRKENLPANPGSGLRVKGMDLK
ncbi:MAG: hypothetical protein LIQ31_07975 [Planctomycetes bacterium]|nr:hypothetical protein [Planctomycetota bacterium]